MKILESAENYLETIYMLQQEKGTVRSIDIAHALNFSKPSVSVAMKNLRENGYVETDASGNILLTDEGLKIAQKVFERHILITNGLIALGVNPETAAADACKIEHVLSEETFAAIKKHMNRLHKSIKNPAL